jgi:hypothetical protein
MMTTKCLGICLGYSHSSHSHRLTIHTKNLQTQKSYVYTSSNVQKLVIYLDTRTYILYKYQCIHTYIHTHTQHCKGQRSRDQQQNQFWRTSVSPQKSTDFLASIFQNLRRLQLAVCLSFFPPLSLCLAHCSNTFTDIQYSKCVPILFFW